MDPSCSRHGFTVLCHHISAGTVYARQLKLVHREIPLALHCSEIRAIRFGGTSQQLGSNIALPEAALVLYRHRSRHDAIRHAIRFHLKPSDRRAPNASKELKRKICMMLVPECAVNKTTSRDSCSCSSRWGLTTQHLPCHCTGIMPNSYKPLPASARTEAKARQRSNEQVA